MKIRSGFVSNSSSSSFCIYGAELSNHAEELAKKFGITEEDLDLYELGEILAEKTGLESETGPDSDSLFVGRSWSSIKDDETGAQFKKSIEQTIKEATGVDIVCDTYSEAWYDG
jgi:hypothetical protein